MGLTDPDLDIYFPSSPPGGHPFPGKRPHLSACLTAEVHVGRMWNES